MLETSILLVGCVGSLNNIFFSIVFTSLILSGAGNVLSLYLIEILSVGSTYRVPDGVGFFIESEAVA